MKQCYLHMTRLFIIFSITLLSFSCSGDNSTNENDPNEQGSKQSDPENGPGVNQKDDTFENAPARKGNGQVPPQNDPDQARLVVSFLSEGEGIDTKLKSDFDKWLTKRQNVTWETESWGREGELNYCFRLSNLSTDEQVIFVQDVRTFLKNNKLVATEEWAKCDKRK